MSLKSQKLKSQSDSVIKSLELLRNFSLESKDITSVELLKQLKHYTSYERSLEYQSKLNPSKKKKKPKSLSNEFDKTQMRTNDTTNCTGSEFSAATSPLGLKTNSISERNLAEGRKSKTTQKSQNYFNFPKVATTITTMTERAINIQENLETPTRIRTKSDVGLPFTNSGGDPSLPLISDRGSVLKSRDKKSVSAFKLNPVLALDSTKVLNILRRKTGRNRSYLMVNQPQNLKDTKVQSKLENEVQDFVRKHFKDDAKERIQTFEKFSFNHSERDDNRVVLTILNELKNPREPSGTMFVTDLWSKELQRECMERSSLVKEKKLVEKYLYYKTKDKNKMRKERGVKPPMTLYSSRDEEIFRNTVFRKKSTMDHEMFMLKKDSELKVLTPLKIFSPDSKKT